MSNWVQEKAYAEANIWQDAFELWSALKKSIAEAVATWTTIYSHPGTPQIVVSSPADAGGNSSSLIVVATYPDNSREDSLEVTFDRHNNLILVTPQPYKKTFHIYVDHRHNRVGLKQQDVPSSKDLLVEDACRLILEPLLDSVGHRRPIGRIED